MSPRFLLTLKKWPLAVKRALSLLDEDSLCGETRSIDFQFGPPSKGRLPLQMRLDGKRVLLCELSDCNPTFLHAMRGWRERCLLHDREGMYHPELLTLDCTDFVLWLAMIHVGWDEDRVRGLPVSLLVIVRSDTEEPIYCFCYTFDVICKLYYALLACLKVYAAEFEDPECWFDVRRFDLLDARSTAGRMMEQFRSEKIEIMHRVLRKK